MFRRTLLVTAIAVAVTAAVAASPADAKSNGFTYVKNGEMFSLRAIKLWKTPKIYAAINKAFGLNPNMGPPETIPQEGGDYVDTTQSQADNCYHGYGFWNSQSWTRNSGK